MTRVHAQERKSIVSMPQACQECVFASKNFGISHGATGIAREQQSIVGTAFGSMMWLSVARECALRRSSIVQRLQRSMLVESVAVLQALTLVKIVQELRIGASNQGITGIQATLAKIQRNGAQTANGVRTCKSVALACATRLLMRVVPASWQVAVLQTVHALTATITLICASVNSGTPRSGLAKVPVTRDTAATKRKGPTC